MSFSDKDKKYPNLLCKGRRCDRMSENNGACRKMRWSMEILYKSTRGNEEKVTASRAILEGLAKDGGLFVPEELPVFDRTMAEFAQDRKSVV